MKNRSENKFEILMILGYSYFECKFACERRIWYNSLTSINTFILKRKSILQKI